MARIDRVASVLRQKISEIILREINDPRIGIVSITDVQVAPDLKSARVYVSIYGDKPKQVEAMKALSSAKRFIRGELGKTLLLRDVPELRFVHDTSLERGSRIIGVLNKLKTSDSEDQINAKTNNRRTKESA